MRIKMKKLILLLTIISCFSVVSFSQEESIEKTKVVLDVNQSIEYALKNSSSIKSADIDLAIKERAGKYGWNILLPSVNATATMNRVSDDTAKKQAQQYGLANTESLHWTGLIGISSSWNFSFAYIAQIKIAKNNYEVGKITFEKSQREIKVNVQKLFYGLLLQQENLKLSKASLENSRQRYIQAEENYKNGAVPELRLLQAQVSYENLKPTVSKSENEFKTSLDTFAFILGYPIGTEIELSGSIEPKYIDLEYDKIMTLYSGYNLDLQNLDKNMELAKMGLVASNLGAYVPSLSMNYSYMPMLTDFLDADKGGYPSGGNWSDNGSFSLTLAWNLTNLLPFSTNRQQAADAKATIKKLEISRNMLLENQKINVRKAVNTLIDAREQIDVMGRNIGLAQRSYDMTARSYRNGTTELLDLRDAEEQLNQAKLGLASQKFNYISAMLDLETELNIDFKEISKQLDNSKTENKNRGE